MSRYNKEYSFTSFKVRTDLYPYLQHVVEMNNTSILAYVGSLVENELTKVKEELSNRIEHLTKVEKKSFERALQVIREESKGRANSVGQSVDVLLPEILTKLDNLDIRTSRIESCLTKETNGQLKIPLK